MTEQFHSIFRQAGSPVARAKFLSRVFGIFSEEIVSLWAHDSRAPYESLGRPSLRAAGEKRGHTLDFTLRDRSTGMVYIAEMKCEIEYEKFKYFVLEHVEQLQHHRKPAFEAFLGAAAQDGTRTAYVGGVPIDFDGAILIWGSATADGKRAVIDSMGFHAILTVAEICQDLASWNHEGYASLVTQRQQWCTDLFAGLLMGPRR